MITWRHYYNNSISIIPIKTDGSKSPAISSWKQYQTEMPSGEICVRWFDKSNPLDGEPKAGMAAVCGAMSQNLICIDFDDPTAFKPWCDSLMLMGMSGYLDEAPIVDTPKGGAHVWLRCEEPVGGNLKLAYDTKRNVRIETRGEGGYALLPGCPLSCHPSGKPYELVNGSFDTIPLLTAHELDRILDAARELDEYQQVAVASAVRSSSTLDDDAPGTVYNANGDIRGLLEKHGWKLVRTHGDTEMWRRPGKNEGISATFNFKGCGCLYVYSSNAAPFEADHSYTPFACLTILEHGGNYSEAAQLLISSGFIQLPKPKRLKLDTAKHDAIYATQDAKEVPKVEGETSTPDEDVDPVTALLCAVKRTLDAANEPEQCWNRWNALDDSQKVSAVYRAALMKITERTLTACINVGKPKEPPQRYKPKELMACTDPDPEELAVIGQLGYGAFHESYCHLVVSQPRIGKSELVAQCMGYWNKPTIYLSEEGKPIWARRLRALASAGLVIPEACEIIPNNGGDRRFVLDLVEAMAPGHVLIIDTLRAYFEIKDECDAGQVVQSVLPLIQAAKNSGITLVVIHHSRKSGGDDAVDASSGSNALPSLFDTILHLEPKGDHLKLSGKARGGSVRNAMMEWENNLLHIIDPVVTRQLTLSEKILNVIPSYAFIDIAGIVDALGDDSPNKESLRAKLRELVADGKVRPEKEFKGGRGSQQRWTKAGTEAFDDVE